MNIYVVDSKAYPGDYSASRGCYVWMTRILTSMGNNRTVFSCPSAPQDSQWDTNLNQTLGGAGESGLYDPYTVTPNSRFSIGYNDWGLGNAVASLSSPQAALGLGGDVDGANYHGPMSDTMVVAPALMIMLADTRALPAGSDNTSWEANLDPTDTTSATGGQLPANRHNYTTDIVFCDGHSERPLRTLVINEATGNIWRGRWNNDNLTHDELSWTPLPAASPFNQLDPSY
jgi:hypothetical protein